VIYVIELWTEGWSDSHTGWSKPTCQGYKTDKYRIRIVVHMLIYKDLRDRVVDGELVRLVYGDELRPTYQGHKTDQTKNLGENLNCFRNKYSYYSSGS